MPTEISVPLAHLTLRGQAWGDPAAPPLLALHGWLDNAASFALLAPLLAAHYRVIALELAGHGHSDHLPAGADYHYLGHVQAVRAAADALNLPRYTLLGHSLGAGVASLVAAAAPERIERLLLIEGLGPAGDDGSRTLQRFREALAAQQENSRPPRVFADVARAVRARCMASGMQPALAQPIVERGLIATAGGWRWRSDPRLTRPTVVRLADVQVHALLKGITAPTRLLLAQPAPPYLPPGPMQARMACVADLRVVYMDGSHHLHLQHPHAVADWIGRAAGRRRTPPLLTTGALPMTLSMYQASVPVFVRALSSLSQVLDKGAEHASAKGVSDQALLQTRLIPDMLPLIKQFQIACDTAARGAARLAAVEPKSFPDTETTLVEVQARIKGTIDYLKSFAPEQIDGSETRAIHLKMRSGDLDFVGHAYLLHYLIPNLYFHCTTAYNILREAGANIGKADFLGKE